MFSPLRLVAVFCLASLLRVICSCSCCLSLPPPSPATRRAPLFASVVKHVYKKRGKKPALCCDLKKVFFHTDLAPPGRSFFFFSPTSHFLFVSFVGLSRKSVFHPDLMSALPNTLEYSHSQPVNAPLFFFFFAATVSLSISSADPFFPPRFCCFQ